MPLNQVSTLIFELSSGCLMTYVVRMRADDSRFCRETGRIVMALSRSSVSLSSSSAPSPNGALMFLLSRNDAGSCSISGWLAPA